MLAKILKSAIRSNLACMTHTPGSFPFLEIQVIDAWYQEVGKVPCMNDSDKSEWSKGTSRRFRGINLQIVFPEHVINFFYGQ